MQQIGTPMPFVAKNFCASDFQIPVGHLKSFKHLNFLIYGKSYTVCYHLMQIHHRCSSADYHNDYLIQ